MPRKLYLKSLSKTTVKELLESLSEAKKVKINGENAILHYRGIVLVLVGYKNMKLKEVIKGLSEIESKVETIRKMLRIPKSKTLRVLYENSSYTVVVANVEISRRKLMKLLRMKDVKVELSNVVIK